MVIRGQLSLGLLLLLWATTGATCNRTQLAAPPPAAFAGPPSLEQVLYAVNANSQRVQQLSTSSATLSGAGMPPLRAELALEQPRRFRLRAQLTPVTGPELDLGSNNEEFWVWVKRGEPPALFFARHAEFSRNSAQRIAPIEPHWLIEALGLVTFDPGAEHRGPFAHGSGQLEIHSRIPTPDGDLNKITVVHDTYGWVLEQHIRNHFGQTLASARASQHRFYPDEGVSLPHVVDVQLPPAQMTFRVEIGEYQVNRLLLSEGDLFVRPQLAGYPALDLADPRVLPILQGQGPEAPASPHPSPPERSQFGYRPRYRGL